MLPIGCVLFILYFCMSALTLHALAKISALKTLKEVKMTNNKNVQQKSNIQEPSRPQKPKLPFPYHEEEVSYENKADGITISGTLTIPSKEEKFPVMFLVSGMGPNDRNYTMLGHEPFLVLSDYLTRLGIAVLRVDKRGVGKSTGTFDTAVTSKDLAGDVVAGIEYLKTRKEINVKQIGLIGHSEGGMIASMVAASSKDIAFLILMAGAIATTVDDVIRQVAMQLRADGATDEMITEDSKVRKQLLSVVRQKENFQVAESKMREIITSYFEELSATLREESERLFFAIQEPKADAIISFFNSPTYRYWLSHNSVSILKQITIPVLAINGDLDFITSSKITLPIVSKALNVAGNRDFVILEMPKLNHWFQNCKSGSIAEYGALEETISPKALQVISDWILARVDKV